MLTRKARNMGVGRCGTSPNRTKRMARRSSGRRRRTSSAVTLTKVARRPPGGLVLGEDLAVGEAGALAGAGEAGVVIAGHGLERVRMDEGVEGRFGLELVDHHVLPGLGAHVVTVERNGFVAAHGEAARHA